MVPTAEVSALQSRQIMECLNIEHIPSMGQVALDDLKAELAEQGGDLSNISAPLVTKLAAAAAEYSEMRKQLSNWMAVEFDTYLELFDLLTEQMSRNGIEYSTSIGNVTHVLGDAFEP